MRNEKEVVAITVSDLHLSHKPPLMRTAEPDWYAVMERQLDELRSLQSQYKCPVLCGGDIFHKWNEPAELIAFAMKAMPKMYAIPGQHDLPYHNYDHRHRTAYGCLEAADIICTLRPGTMLAVSDCPTPLNLHGFPWGFEFTECREADNLGVMQIAVVHEYVWAKGFRYKGAPAHARISKHKEIMKTYNVCIFGDNHKGFTVGNMVNNGTFIRRSADEKKSIPKVGIIYEDGYVERRELECCDADLFIDVNESMALIEKALDMGDFIDELATLGTDAFDFLKALKRFCEANNVNKHVRAIISEMVDGQ